jgi:serine/threonine protein kinase
MSSESPRLYTDNPNALPVGTRLGEFELLGLLGVGGFGIVYLAFDHTLEREVAVKEYMPAALAGRTQTMHVSLRSQSDAETFALGLRSFVNEARLLARFDHPALLKVFRFWEANGTAYMAMPVMRGHTLKDELQQMLGRHQVPTEAWLRSILDPLLDALAKLHSEGVYHRDIAPDNIQIEPDGHPVLLDFGAARRVLSDKSQTLTAILKPAYAPIEQYAEAGAVKQGPWTDIYALGATLYFLMLKRPPAPATARAVHDEASALTPEALPAMSGRFLHIVNWMLAPRPADRPQNVAALRRVLDGQAPPPLPRVEAPPEPVDWDSTVILRAAPLGPGSITQNLAPVLSTATVVPLTGSAASAFSQGATALKAAPKAAPKAALNAAPKAMPAVKAAGAKSTLNIGLAAVVLVAGTALAALLYFFWPHPAPGNASPPVVLVEPSALPAPAKAQTLPTAGPAPDNASAAEPITPVRATAGEVPVGLAGLAGGAEPLPANALPPPQPTAADVPTATVSAAPVVVAKPLAAEKLPPAKRPPTAQPIAPVSPRAPTAQTTSPYPPQGGAAPAATPATRSGYGDAPAVTQGGVVSPVPNEPTKAPVLGPEVQCSGMPYFKNLMCMEKQCLRSDNQSHPDCLKWRKNTRTE